MRTGRLQYYLLHPASIPAPGWLRPLALLTCLITNTLWAAEPVAADSKAIIGAGAHFSWFVFDKLEPELEKKFGRELVLYGRQSMLGAGCNAGIRTARENRSGHETFGLVCCPLSEKEIREKELTVHPIALEPVVILVHESNPVNDLSLSQTRKIFRGQITNWKEVGGPDRPIVVVTRLHCKARPGHWKTLLPSADQFRKDRLNTKSAAEMVKRVNDFPGAIGHTGATWEFGDAKVKTVSIDGVKPSASALRNKRYPFYRQLSAVTHGPISPDLKAILHEVQTGDGFRAVAARYHLLPLQ